MSRKLVSDPYLAIHGKIMAKNGHFFMEFWPIFDIFHGLRPYLCSKRGHLGFHKQATHRRRGDEPFFYSGVDRSWLGMAQKWSILDQKWPNMAGLSTVQSGPKWKTWLFLTICNPFGPICSLLNHFRQKSIFCSFSRVWRRCFWTKKSFFVWNGPKGPQMIKNN